MAIRPSNPEIITVNSEALQTQIRDLLPSQNGFGSELQASNVITPIIDLTATAEGSRLPFELQTAASFGSATEVAAGGTVVMTSTPGWYRFIGSVTVSGSGVTAEFSMTDGLSTKSIWNLTTFTADQISQNVDLIFAVSNGITLSAIAATGSNIVGSFRQIANGQGELVNPVGLPL